MHFYDLLSWDEYEQAGWTMESVSVRRDKIAPALVRGIDNTESLEILGAIILLLQDQIHRKIINPMKTTISSLDIHYLYVAYTKLNIIHGLNLDRLWFTTWEEFEFECPEVDEFNPAEYVASIQISKLSSAASIVRSMIEKSWETVLFQSVDLEMEVGWPTVHSAMSALRRAFSAGVSSTDFASIGQVSLSLIGSVSDILWESGDFHLPSFVTRDDPDALKNRLGQVIEVEFKGSSKTKARNLVFSALDYAQSVKHNRAATREDARLVADAAIFVAELLWQAVGDKEPTTQINLKDNDVPF